MTPIEAMAKAYETEHRLWSSGHYEKLERGEIVHAVWRDGDEIERSPHEGKMHRMCEELRKSAAMRAALLALAECELPSSIVVGQWDMAVFRATIRAIAEDKPA